MPCQFELLLVGDDANPLCNQIMLDRLCIPLQGWNMISNKNVAVTEECRMTYWEDVSPKLTRNDPVSMASHRPTTQCSTGAICQVLMTLGPVSFPVYGPMKCKVGSDLRVATS